jgi:hypothetical protein
MSYRADGYIPPATGSGVDGYTTIISGQYATGLNGHGGKLILRSGVGSADGYDGYVYLETGTRILMVLDGYNVGFFPTGITGSFDTAKGVISIANATTTPTTSPTGGALFYSQDGDGYWLTPNSLVQSISSTRIVRQIPSDANYTAVQADYQAKIMEFTSVTLNATRDVVVPITSGYQWTVFNNTTGSQSLRFIGATGTGITVAVGKRAIIYADGTNIVRVTPDT